MLWPSDDNNVDYLLEYFSIKVIKNIEMHIFSNLINHVIILFL